MNKQSPPKNSFVFAVLRMLFDETIIYLKICFLMLRFRGEAPLHIAIDGISVKSCLSILSISVFIYLWFINLTSWLVERSIKDPSAICNFNRQFILVSDVNYPETICILLFLVMIPLHKMILKPLGYAGDNFHLAKTLAVASIFSPIVAGVQFLYMLIIIVPFYHLHYRNDYLLFSSSVVEVLVLVYVAYVCIVMISGFLAISRWRACSYVAILNTIVYGALYVFVLAAPTIYQSCKHINMCNDFVIKYRAKLSCRMDAR
jgi:hypothetical protein